MALLGGRQRRSGRRRWVWGHHCGAGDQQLLVGGGGVGGMVGRAVEQKLAGGKPAGGVSRIIARGRRDGGCKGVLVIAHGIRVGRTGHGDDDWSVAPTTGGLGGLGGLQRVLRGWNQRRQSWKPFNRPLDIALRANEPFHVMLRRSPKGQASLFVSCSGARP